VFLGREGERQPEEGPACWLWEQNSQSRGTILGKKTEEEVAACMGGGELRLVPAGRGEDIGSVGCSGGKNGC